MIIPPFCTSAMLLPSVLLLITLDNIYTATPPNIVIILADDLGWNDVSFHGSNQFSTPNIDALAYSGVILHNYYTQPICTPARAALLTGRHPIHNGMNHKVIYASQPWGLPLTERLLPQYLKSLGYVTRGVGKWHLGFFKADYTPTRRGFDSFYGSWAGHQNHFTHMANKNHPGYDLHRDLNVSWEGYGRFAADLFTEEAETIINNHNIKRPLFLYLAHTAPHTPIQAPQETIGKLKHVPGRRRRTYAAMVTKVDESVGRVTQALKDKNMLNNSIILFLSDNGGTAKGNIASNWPLRGGKDTLWEGGVRGVGLIWSPLLQAVPRVHQGLVNIQDWLPTLLSATGSYQLEDFSKLDGVSQWGALNNLTGPPYNTMLHNIDPRRNIGALRQGDWKIVVGRTFKGNYDSWYGRLISAKPHDLDSVRDSMVARAVGTTSTPLPEPHTIHALHVMSTVSCMPTADKDNVFTTACKPHRRPCLFNIAEDPCEINNVAISHPHVVQHMLGMLMDYQTVRPKNRPGDSRSYPYHWNNTWTHWQDFV